MSRLDGTISQKEGIRLPDIQPDKLTSFGQRFRDLRAQEKLKRKQQLGNTTQQTISRANAKSVTTIQNTNEQKPPLRSRGGRRKNDRASVGTQEMLQAQELARSRVSFNTSAYRRS